MSVPTVICYVLLITGGSCYVLVAYVCCNPGHLNACASSGQRGLIAEGFLIKFPVIFIYTEACPFAASDF